MGKSEKPMETIKSMGSIAEDRSEEEILKELATRIEYLRQQTDFTAALFKSISGYAVIAANFDGEIIAYNTGAEHIYGYPAEKFFTDSKNVDILFPKDFIEAGGLQDIINSVMSKGIHTYVGEKVRQNGERFPAKVILSLVKTNNGKMIGFVEIVEDLTERKQFEDKIRRYTAELEQTNEKLKEIDRLKSMFIASMSHELRTPLNAIIGFSSILLNEWTGPLNAEQKENMSILLRSGKHLLALINDVIDVSKIEAGKIDVRVEEFDLCDVILEVVTLMKKDMDEKRLELKVESIHQKMHTDRQRLLQCVLNLVSNAVKFTEKGTIHVGAGPAPAQKQEGQPQGLPLQDFVEISVSDTGIGIKEEDIPKLFQSFVRLDSPLRSKVKGTGLGLYLTKKLSTDVLNGEITAISEYGKGSRFVIRVPVKL